MNGKGRRAADRRRERAEKEHGPGAPGEDADAAEHTVPAAAPLRAPLNPDELDEEPSHGDAPVERAHRGGEVPAALELPATQHTRQDRAERPRRAPVEVSVAEASPEVSFAREVKQRGGKQKPADEDEITEVKELSNRVRRGGRLVVLSAGPGKSGPCFKDGEELPLALTPSLMGRSTSAEIVVADETVSLRHAEITRTSAGFTITDLGSRSGTLLNGHVLRGEQSLVHGDVVSLGKTELRFFVADKEPAPRPEKVSPPAAPVETAKTDKPEPTRIVSPREATRVLNLAHQNDAELEILGDRKRKIRQRAAAVIGVSVVVLVLLVAGKLAWPKLFPQNSPAQLQAQAAQVLLEGQRHLASHNIDSAYASAQTVLAISPDNAEAMSLLKMAGTERDARDALALALRLADEDRDQEALQILKRVPAASYFAAGAQELQRLLVERAAARSLRAIEALLDKGDVAGARLAMQTHLKNFPNDELVAALLANLDAPSLVASGSANTASLSRARALFAAGNLSDARSTASGAGFRGYVRDLDRFEQALAAGKRVLAEQQDGQAALKHLDEAYRLLPLLGGGPQTAIMADTRKPYANALYFSGQERLERGDRCGAARDLFRALRVMPDDIKLQTKVRELDAIAEQGLTRARSSKPQDRDRAAAWAREALCVARSGTRTHDELKALAGLD